MSNKILEQSYIPFQCMIVNSIAQNSIEEIGTAQYYILDLLNAEGKITAKELAEKRGITQSGISKLNKKLLDRGYIIQEKSKTDRRYYDLSITDEGRAFLKRTEIFRNSVLKTIANSLSPEEIVQFAKLCDKITKNEKQP